MNYDVPSRRNLRSVAAQDFPDPAANAVAHNRAAQGLLDADAEATSRSQPNGLVPDSPCIGAEKYRKLRARAALPRAVNGFEIGAAQQARGAGKILPRSVRGSRRA
jgi:hypothetical protein